MLLLLLYVEFRKYDGIYSFYFLEDFIDVNDLFCCMRIDWILRFILMYKVIYWGECFELVLGISLMFESLFVVENCVDIFDIWMYFFFVDFVVGNIFVVVRRDLM